MPRKRKTPTRAHITRTVRLGHESAVLPVMLPAGVCARCGMALRAGVGDQVADARLCTRCANNLSQYWTSDVETAGTHGTHGTQGAHS